MDLCKDAVLELIYKAPSDSKVLDHAIVLGLVLPLSLIDYQLGITVDLNVLCSHLMGQCQSGD